MRIAIIGQRDFGKGVLEAFLGRADTIAGVFCAPEKPGSSADPVAHRGRAAANSGFQLASLKTEEARETLRALDVELG